MEVVRIPIDELDASYQTRVKTDEATVEKYATDFNEYGGWGDFPPLEVIVVCGVKHIANGIHRYKAAKLVGLSECPCTVRDGTLLEVHEISTRGNYRQGLSYTAADRRHSRELAILTFWPTGEYTPKEIGDACECSDDTIRREIKRLESEGKLEHVDFVVGADGKKYPTHYSKPASANAEPETKQPDYTLCPQCGTPIWPENKGNPDYTYTERNGQWFCSEECADQWEQERLSDEAEALTGIPDELPDIPSAALPTHEEDEPEPVKHGAEPVLTEDDENRQIVEEIAELLKNFRPQRINNIIILLFNVLNLKVENIFKTRKKNILKGINAESYEKNPLSEEEKTGFVWKLNDGSDWELARPYLETFKTLYPGIDVEQELRNSIGWSIANPKNRKTKTGILKHLTTWLGNAQNRAARQGAQRPAVRKSGYVSRDAGLDFENLEY